MGVYEMGACETSECWVDECFCLLVFGVVVGAGAGAGTGAFLLNSPQRDTVSLAFMV